jgi:sodium--glutamate symport carrier gltS
MWRIIVFGFPGRNAQRSLGKPSLNKALVLELMRCEWIEKRQNCIALGPSGIGKTHTALGLGLAACQKGYSVAFTTAAARRDLSWRATRRSEMITARFGLENAMEIGVAAATLGLVIASLVGGPVARFLIARHGLSGPLDTPPMIGLPDDTPRDDLNHVSLLQTILVLNVAILIGFGIHEALVEAGLKLPLFVACLLSAIALTNTVPRLFPKLP